MCFNINVTIENFSETQSSVQLVLGLGPKIKQYMKNLMPRFCHFKLTIALCCTFEQLLKERI